MAHGVSLSGNVDKKKSRSLSIYNELIYLQTLPIASDFNVFLWFLWIFRGFQKVKNFL